LAHRRDKPTKKKDSVRFVVISPRASGPLSFSDRLFDPANLSFPRRVGATLISAVCFCAGSILIALGARDLDWFLGLAGALAVFYGVGWARVALEGRSPGGRLRLNPWRRR